MSFYSPRRMTAWLEHSGHAVHRKRVQWQIGLAAIYQKPATCRPSPEHNGDPDLVIAHANQV